MDYYAHLAVEAMERGGYRVSPADRVPGLYDIEGLARDVTIDQLWMLSQSYGAWNQNAFATNAFGLPPA